MSLKGNNRKFRTKIIRIESSGPPALLIRMENRREQIVKLTDIQYINKYRTFENKTWKWIGGMYMTIGVFAMVENARDNYHIALPFIGFGSIPFLFRNEKFYIDNSKIELVYQ